MSTGRLRATTSGGGYGGGARPGGAGRGRLAAGLAAPADVLVSGAAAGRGRFAADGGFATAQDELPPGSCAGAVLTDRQQRRQAVYQPVLGARPRRTSTAATCFSPGPTPRRAVRRRRREPDGRNDSADRAVTFDDAARDAGDGAGRVLPVRRPDLGRPTLDSRGGDGALFCSWLTRLAGLRRNVDRPRQRAERGLRLRGASAAHSARNTTTPSTGGSSDFSHRPSLPARRSRERRPAAAHRRRNGPGGLGHGRPGVLVQVCECGGPWEVLRSAGHARGGDRLTLSRPMRKPAR